ncbi:WD repeat and FYVE domain-containing protein 3 isoform X2 [Anopheles darlingi]|uniref:WD repeat and FYVE domain-containing protein 3 isoform X2 n=1 Tax=Anopheles darlingi TaxID=43151 RepID=UPI0021002C41|nr:WD repeat and FYVE domain-containing protein 3 isoform X2 [Anopheles darlingi]
MNVPESIYPYSHKCSNSVVLPNEKETDLTLLHLEKLFNEFINSKSQLTEHEQATRLYHMAPLYCNIFKPRNPVSDGNDRSATSASTRTVSWEFNNAFCYHISYLLAKEIKHRASNQSTEGASKSIATYLQFQDSEAQNEPCNGWMLLTAINIMIATDDSFSLQKIMINASLPSTLVRCIYLFLDLPEEEKECDISARNSLQKSEAHGGNCLLLLYSTLSQILHKLCSLPSAVEELIVMDDLTLLFSTVTTQFAPCNTKWRALAREILFIIAEHGLSNAILSYLHGKGCIALCLDNMRRSSVFKPLDTVEMLLSISAFLQRSCCFSQTLLDDFKLSQGYQFIIDFLLKVDLELVENGVEENDVLENVLRMTIPMIVSLCTTGFTQTQTLVPCSDQKQKHVLIPKGQPQEFRVPHISAKGSCVRNLNAFQVLQTVFLRASTALLCCKILEAIMEIYRMDDANYFILESLNTLCLFAEKIHLKPKMIQSTFFELVEFIVIQLNFVPRKELISLSVILKSNYVMETSVRCTRTLVHLLRINNGFVDVYREVGILEVFVTCMKRYKEYLCIHMDAIASEMEESLEKESLGRLVLEGLGMLLNGNATNTAIFKNCGGNKCIYEMMKYDHYSPEMLKIVRELISTVGGEDDMLNLLKNMNADRAPNSTSIRMNVLQFLIECLRESHRSRAFFRKVGGFVYVVNVLESLKGQFTNIHLNNELLQKNVRLFRVVCQTLSAAMRFEPANAKYFQSEISNTLFYQAIREFGCFSDTEIIQPYTHSYTDHTNVFSVDEQKMELFKTVFHMTFDTTDKWDMCFSDSIPWSLNSICIIYRVLYDIVLDIFDKQETCDLMQTSRCNTTKPVAKSDHPIPNRISSDLKTSTSTVSTYTSDCLIVHPCIIECMLKLLPSVADLSLEKNNTDTRPTMHSCTMTLQFFLAEVIKSLVRSERNQQILCDSGLNHLILHMCKEAFIDELHPLHTPLQHIFERLAVQALKPQELRSFLRLTLTNRNEESKPSEISLWKNAYPPVPLTRVKTLVSIATPRDFRAHGSVTLPSFIEMDMSTEGFGCLFFPNIAPNQLNHIYSSTLQRYATASKGTGTITSEGICSKSSGDDTGTNILWLPTGTYSTTGSTSNSTIYAQECGSVGGIGTGDRVFPAATGFTFSTWFCIECVPHANTDNHPIRLLHIIRTNDNIIDDAVVVFGLLMLPNDKSLLITTEEMAFSTAHCSNFKEGYYARIWCTTFLEECQWHHIGLTLNKNIPKMSTLSIYIDGRLVHTQNIHPIQSGLHSNDNNIGNSVHAIIGTPPIWRKYSSLVWKQGVCHLVDEVFDASIMNRVYALGPHYTGSFQDVRLKDEDDVCALVSEERMTFGVNPKAYSYMTLSKIRKVYNRADAKAIGKQLGMSSHENATPILILHNCAGHLIGPARTLGGVLVGYLGIRKFNPFPVSMAMNSIGGCSVLLGLVAMSQNIESLYAAVKTLACILRTNKSARQEMISCRYYQTLGMLFKRKKHLLNSHILHLTFNVVGTIHTGFENTTIPNITAFHDLLCDFDIWLDTSNDLIRSLIEHLLELAEESNAKLKNIRVMQDLQCLPKLLFIIEYITEDNALNALFSFMYTLLNVQTRCNDLLLFGQYILNSIPEMSNIEADLEMSQRILIRNRCLQTLHSLLFGNNNVINLRLCDDISRVLGMDWILLLMQPHLHRSTMLWAMRLLVILLAREPMLIRFRDGTGSIEAEGYLKNTELVSKSRNAILLSSSVPQMEGEVLANVVTASSSENGGSQQSLVLMGFPYLEWLLLHRTDVPEVYSLLISLVLGCPTKSTELPSDSKSLEEIWSFVWLSDHPDRKITKQSSDKSLFCSEAICVLLTMIRKVIHDHETGTGGAQKNCSSDYETEANTIQNRLQRYSTDVMKLLMSFYEHIPEFASIVMSADVIASIIATLYPPPFPLLDPVLSKLCSTTLKSSNSLHSAGESLNENVNNAITSKTMPECTNDSYERSESACFEFHMPSAQHVLEFLLTLVSESLPLTHTAKSPPVIDCVLEIFIPYNIVSEEQRKHFLTKIISLIINHLLSSNVLQALSANNLLSLNSTQSLAANVFYVASRIVDKLWQRMLYIDGREILDFCIHLILKMKQYHSSTVSSRGVSSGHICNIGNTGSLESIYRSLNRCILYLLAYPPRDNDSSSLVEVLQLIMTNRLLVFGAGNHDPDFIGCLTYCLLQLNGQSDASDKKSIVLTSTSPHASRRTTTWHVDTLFAQEQEPNIRTNPIDLPNISSMSSKLDIVSFRVWEELYICKKPVIEEIFKVTLAQPVRNSRAPDMKQTEAQICDVALKHWMAFLEGERRSIYKAPWEGNKNIQSKIQKVTGGLTRLTSRSKLKKDNNKRRIRPNELSAASIEQICFAKLMPVRDYWELRIAQHSYNSAHSKRYVYQDWLQTEAELIRERAIWGPDCCADFTKWILDSTEGPYRMRKKMLRNDLFYVHYPARQQQLQGINADSRQPRQIKCRVAISHDSEKYNAFVQQYRCMFPEQFEYDSNSNRGGIVANDCSINNSESPKPQRTTGDDCLDNDEDVCSSLPDNQVLLRLLEEREKVSHIFRTARIQGLDTFEGLLLIGKECCYIVDGLTLLRNREIRDIDSLPKESFEPIIPSTATGSSQIVCPGKRQSSKLFYEDIREIHKRRYLLQPVALELFCEDGQNYLLSFPCKVRNKVFQKLISNATNTADNAHLSVAGQKRAANVEQNTGLLSGLIGETSVTQRWVRGELSNFQYLMHLNSLAGRSYNDLMQYPVFPWILSNYTSETLDLTDASNFRDLAKPMGAQSEDRLEQFVKRFNDWDDPQGDTPPYHYGTHYSSAMIVCAYLVRMEPFTQHFLRLQGGHFDLADRMFHSIQEAWYSASRQNMADVKELIPEFFYLPEFLENENRFDLGTKQNGEVLNNVILPPWAKNDAREFIRVHREALECEYVSRHLHLWIDLIFGYKQRGQASVEAINVFHHLFYEGNVDIYNIEDPLQKNAAIGFINNFGQIPKQLFRKAHPAKKMNPLKHLGKLMDVSPLITPSSALVNNATLCNEKIFFYHLNKLKPSAQPVKEIKGPVGQIILQDKNILAVEQNKILIPNAYNRYVSWGFADHSIRIGSYEADRASFIFENIDQCGEILASASPSVKQLILAGTSTVLLVYSIDIKSKKINLQQTLFGHKEAVTVLASSSAYNIIVSGSRDRTAIIWNLSRLTYVRQLTGHVGVLTAVAINELTGDIATCSGTWLYVWSINGVKLSFVNTSTGCSNRMQQILCTTFSYIKEWDDKNVIITGSTDGVVRMWSMEFRSTSSEEQRNKQSSLECLETDTKDAHVKPMLSQKEIKKDWIRQLVLRVDLTMNTAYDRKTNAEPASITALAISKDHQWVYVGDARGRVFAWTVTESPFSHSTRMISGFQKHEDA